MPDSLEQVPLFPNVRVLIPSHFRDKIKFLCEKINTIEWSGILFYRTQGNFGKEDFHCILEDVLLMDIGNRVKTSYRPHGLNVFLEKNPALRDCRKGHIHSHHNMNVWFSSTDQEELQLNTKKHCYYLSVIVNNREVVIGQFCYMADSVEKRNQTLSVRLAPGKNDVRVVVDEVVEKRILCQHKCQFESYSTKIDEQFEMRVQEIATPHNSPAQSEEHSSSAEKATEPTCKTKTGGTSAAKKISKPKFKGEAKALKKGQKRTPAKKAAPGGVKKEKK